MSAARDPAAQPVLSLSGVSAHYGAVEVLRGISLDVARHEAVAVLGRNGVGKTTLVHALFNLGPSLGGRVRVMGQDVAGWPTHRIARLGVGLVPQGRGIFPNLTVTENLRLATVRRRPGAWTLDRIFETFPRLAERRASFSGTLSGGERQMLAISRALLTQPELLVLDEPSEGLAPLMAEEIILGTLGKLAAEGLTVLLVEQNLTLALRLCPRAVVLAEHRIVFDGMSSTLLADRSLVSDYLGV
ncbi:ABC transporter ATP-binding protein [Roseomonas xinghualingensis]|uniref:ABC transporter ATP-binding protein n=1 Tax=Roseomonas xinghualingensis TaxID=2986475 RepID=UPI0021F0EAD1|nr:ABC transporter ATP-binding protein [Roseomonas sp. SXEYE001]MCV4209202.1 ABC transporter ATP-binding protein [Roseomonas sp. SXEYE001]